MIIETRATKNKGHIVINDSIDLYITKKNNDYYINVLENNCYNIMLNYITKVQEITVEDKITELKNFVSDYCSQDFVFDGVMEKLEELEVILSESEDK